MNTNPAQILFVDDEKPILNSLKRLLRPTGHRVHTAHSGADGLEILKQNHIDLVVSDMRMPEMDGAQFLSAVASQWPNTTRMLLTGYADLSSAIDAINKGSISRYLTKPWQDADIVMCIEQAVQTLKLEQEKSQLEALAVKQNSELKALNETLEERVAKRTRQIELAQEQLVVANDELKANYSSTIEIFSRLIHSRAGIGCRASVARDARALGQQMGLNDTQVAALYDAALLCDIGKLSLPDSSVKTPYTLLDAKAQRRYHQHPIISEATLISLQPLADAARIVRMHCERPDGSGFPDRISGDDIPLEARILAVCKSFADLQDGRFFKDCHTVEEARTYLDEQKNRRYDANVVDQFFLWLENENRKTDEPDERKVTIESLRPAMTTTRDLHDANQVLILAKGQRISAALIERLSKLQKAIQEPLTIYVRK